MNEMNEDTLTDASKDLDLVLDSIAEIQNSDIASPMDKWHFRTIEMAVMQNDIDEDQVDLVKEIFTSVAYGMGMSKLNHNSLLELRNTFSRYGFVLNN